MGFLRPLLSTGSKPSFLNLLSPVSQVFLCSSYLRVNPKVGEMVEPWTAPRSSGITDVCNERPQQGWSDTLQRRGSVASDECEKCRLPVLGAWRTTIPIQTLERAQHAEI